MPEQAVAEPVHLLSIMGLFSNYEKADEGFKYLTELGYDHDHIVIVLSDTAPKAALTGTTASHIRTDAQHGPEPSAPGVEKSTKAIEGLGVGSSIGALAGAMIGSAQQKERQRRIAALPPKPTRDGFLVVVKIPLRLAEQCESIARRLGAKEIIL